MTDPITTLKARVEKAESKVARYSKLLESAKKELADLHTTLRVMGEIAGESPADLARQSATSTSSRQQEIANLLSVGRVSGRSPITLFDAYSAKGSDDINIDTFRTTIWRMKGKAYNCDGQDYVIQSGDGEYWKEKITHSVEQDIDDLLG